MNKIEKIKIKNLFAEDLTIKKVNAPQLSGYLIKKNDETVGTWIKGVINKKIRW